MVALSASSIALANSCVPVGNSLDFFNVAAGSESQTGCLRIAMWPSGLGRLVHAGGRKIIGAHRHRQQVGLERKKRDLARRHAARHAAQGVEAAAALLPGVSFQALPIEPALNQEINAAGMEGDKSVVEVTAVIESRLLHEDLVFGLLFHYRAGEQIENSAAAKRGEVNRQDRRIIGGEPGEDRFERAEISRLEVRYGSDRE